LVSVDVTVEHNVVTIEQHSGAVKKIFGMEEA
jgi:hypothetical protein